MSTGAVHKSNKKHVSVKVKDLVALRRLQKPQGYLTSTAAFSRITREVMAELKHGLRLQPAAVEAIQTASEDYLHKLFRKASTLAAHAGRTLVTAEDIALVKTLDDIAVE
jgi:histone H3/H4